MRYRELISEAKVIAQGLLMGPTSSDMSALCAKEDYRGITCNNKVYVGKAYAWTHHAMAERLGISFGVDYDIFYASTNERNQDKDSWDNDAWLDGSDPDYDHPKGFIIFGGDRDNAGFNLMVKGAQLDEDLEDPRLDDEDNRTRGSRAATLFRYYDDNNIGFRVMDHQPDRHAPERPLAVVIHPGDMINAFYGSLNDLPEDERELARQSIRFGSENQAGMQKELAELRRKGYDFVVLHRESSVQYPENKFHETRKKVWIELQAGHKRGSMLFGDDLDRAAQWMIKNLHIEDRPHVYMLGAYSDPELGCLTHIGQQFAKVIDPSKITVSKFSPVSDDPSEQHKAWSPKKEIQESYGAVDDVAMTDLLSPCGKSHTIGAEKGRYNPEGISIYRSPHGSTRYVYSGAGEPLAVLQVMSRDGRDGVIANAYTVLKARRNGLASKLLDRARKDFNSVKHSDSLSSDGAAWARAVTESVQSVFIDVANEYYEDTVEVFRNPSRVLFMKQMREHNHARGFLNPMKNELYVWFEGALHADIDHSNVDGEVWLTWNEPVKGKCLIQYDSEYFANSVDVDAEDYSEQVEKIILGVRPFTRLLDGFIPNIEHR